MGDKTLNGNEKLKYMIDLLKEANGEALTTSMLMRLLDCNRNSVNNYYKRCIDNGIPVIKTNVGHETGYYLEDCDNVFEPMSTDMVRKFMIMQMVKPGKEEKQELLGVNYNKREDAYYSLGSIGDIGTTKYYNLINELIDEGELIRIDGKYYPGRKNIPVQWFVNEREALDYINILTMLPPGYHGQNIVESVFRKINAIYDTEERTDRAYIVMGRKYTLLNRIHNLISAIKKADYINRLIRISYEGQENDIIVAVGLVVYSVEKDKLYLLGERRGSGADPKKVSGKKDHTVFLDVEKIKGVKPEKGMNRSYHSRKYIDLFNRMFSIGNSKLVDAEKEKIEIAFDKDDYTEERLQNLCEYRASSRASLEERDGKLIYRDNIIGIDDLFRFLRQFTGKYEILNSEVLQQKKIESLKLMLKRYSEEDVHE